MTEKELRHKNIWSGTYRGINFEIVHWGVGESYRPNGTWNYYLFIPLDMIPERVKHEFLAKSMVDKRGYVNYDYYDLKLLCDLDWHGGITYYEKLGTDGAPVTIKTGCDYAHIRDEGHDPSLREVLYDCKNTIEALWRAIPDMLLHCPTIGGYHKLSDGVFDPDSNLYKDVVIPKSIKEVSDD